MARSAPRKSTKKCPENTHSRKAHMRGGKRIKATCVKNRRKSTLKKSKTGLGNCIIVNVDAELMLDNNGSVRAVRVMDLNSQEKKNVIQWYTTRAKDLRTVYPVNEFSFSDGGRYLKMKMYLNENAEQTEIIVQLYGDPDKDGNHPLRLRGANWIVNGFVKTIKSCRM